MKHTSHPRKQVFVLLGVIVALGAAALVVPRALPYPEGGIAAAASAALVFFGLLFTALAVAVYLLVFTLNRREQLVGAVRLAGVAPAAILAVALAVLVAWLRF